MDAAFIAERITELRLERNVSEYQMSLELGQSKGYVQGITSGKCLPSAKQLFNIADYQSFLMMENTIPPWCWKPYKPCASSVTMM